ncbi:hypothetical protein ACFX12_022944 [Malus domestica]
MVASASSTNVHTGSTKAMHMDVIVSVPFALVDEISDASQQQRMVCSLEIPVILVRQGAQVNLTMTPRTWQGRGLLG